MGRNTSSWCQNLREILCESEDLQEYVRNSLPYADEETRNKEIKRLARSITNVELGLTLLKEVAPQDPAISVATLLKGYRFPFPVFESDNNWELIQKARFYLILFKGKTQWERSLKEYIQIPETLRTFQVDAVGDIPQLIPCSIYPRRWQLYLDTLNKVPKHNKTTLNLAHHHNWYANIRDRGESVEILIRIPENVANIESSTNRISFQRTRQNNNPSVTVSLEQLQREAEEMDRKLAENEQDAENFSYRLSNVIWRLYDENSDDFQLGEELVLERLIHIVGLLNVGKTTLLLVLIYFLAKKGHRCALIVNDVVATVRLASLFRFGLEIEAAPILGNNRSEHLQKVYEPILSKEGEDIFVGASHPAWRWLSDICPLLSLVKAEEKWCFGNEPCHQLYQKIHIAINRE